MNAFRHGYRGRAWQLLARRIRNAIRLCARTVLLVRVLKAQQDRRPALLQSLVGTDQQKGPVLARGQGRSLQRDVPP